MAAKYQGKHVAANVNANKLPRFDERDESLIDDPSIEDVSLAETELPQSDEIVGAPFDSPIDETEPLIEDRLVDEPYDEMPYEDAPFDDAPYDDELYDDVSSDEEPSFAPVIAAGSAAGDKGGHRKKPDGGKGPSKSKGKAPRGKRSALGNALLIIGIILLIAAVVLGIYISKDYINARARYGDLREAAGNLEVFDEVFNGEKDLFDIQLDWDALKEQNPDIVGWIYVENTNINYPIVQAKDNVYYLDHNADGNPSSSGAIFLDSANKLDMSCDANFIYGHNMMDGSMFADITKFKKQSFLDQNNRIIIVTPEHAWILGCAFTFIADGSEKIRKTDFDTPDELHEYIQDLLDNRAVTSSLVDVNEIDKLFCLVTCSYERNDARTVLCAVEQRAIDFPKS